MKPHVVESFGAVLLHAFAPVLLHAAAPRVEVRGPQRVLPAVRCGGPGGVLRPRTPARRAFLPSTEDCCALLCICSKAKTRGPRAEQRFRWARRAAHPRRGYSCYIYGMQTRGADRAGADVEYNTCVPGAPRESQANICGDPGGACGRRGKSYEGSLIERVKNIGLVVVCIPQSPCL